MSIDQTRSFSPFTLHSFVCKRHKPHVTFCGLKSQKWLEWFPPNLQLFSPSNFLSCFFSLSATILLAVKIYERGTPTRVGCEYKQQEWLEDMSHKPCELPGRQVERPRHGNAIGKRADAAKPSPGQEAQTNRLPSSCAGVFGARHAG